uniref:Uncharacterized protein n=1 Tax=Peronospora matthiolae TaxID=2874970 RepID=A0AAV1TCZ5_9STRA
MADRIRASVPSAAPVPSAASVASDVGAFSAASVDSMPFSMAAKRAAADAFEGASGEEFESNGSSEQTIDGDVVVRPLVKKSKWIDEELPDVDEEEEFPQQRDERDDEELTRDLVVDGEKEGMETVTMDEGVNSRVRSGSQEMESVDLGTGRSKEVIDWTEEEEEEEEEVDEERKVLAGRSCGIDIVDVEDAEEEEDGDGDGYEQSSDRDIEEEEEEEEETAQVIGRARNQREARQLLQQLDGSTRSKLCLTVLEKYGEELLYGHEDARDAILVDACAQESALSLVRDAVRIRDFYARGSSAEAPVELDDDDDNDDSIDEDEDAVVLGAGDVEEEREDEAGGYEDEVEDADEDGETLAGGDDDNDDIVVISEEEVEETLICEQYSESHHAGPTTDDLECCESGKNGDARLEDTLQPVDNVGGGKLDDDKYSGDDNEKEEDMDGETAAHLILLLIVEKLWPRLLARGHFSYASDKRTRTYIY